MINTAFRLHLEVEDKTAGNSEKKKESTALLLHFTHQRQALCETLQSL